MILRDFLRAVAQVEDPRFLRVFLVSLALTFVLLVFVYGLMLWFIASVSDDALHLPMIGEVTWVGDLLHWKSLLILLGFSALLMIPVASATTAFFLDDVADAVEARHYPGLQPAYRHSPAGAVAETVGYFAFLGVVNLLLLVPYVFFPPSIPFLFFGINGLMLGWEYFTLVAKRRLPPAEFRRLRLRNLLRIWTAGILMALPLTIPLVNLLIPALGAATFCHLFHRVAPQPVPGPRGRRTGGGPGIQRNRGGRRY